MSDDAGLFDVPGAPASTGTGQRVALGANTHASAPLPVRMRPRTLDELVGQEQLLAPGSPLRQLIEGDQPTSLLLWGPPGTGKTTIAGIVSQQTDRRFVEVSAVSAGVKEVRAAIDAARAELTRGGRETVLFVDEVHRFSKAQQDALLPGVENRWVTLVAATTENPFFCVISPLLSRSLLLRLQPLTDDDVREVMDARRWPTSAGSAAAYELDEDAGEHLVRLAGGDARRVADLPGGGRPGRQRPRHRPDRPGVAEAAVDQAAVRYDRQGDQHYDVISAFIKSIRGSDVDAALHYLARMIEAGEDPRFIARRLVILASEDIGLADPTALHGGGRRGAGGAADRHARGAASTWPRPRSTSPSRPSPTPSITAIDAALADVRAGKIGNVPPHLRDAHYGGAEELGHGQGYVYSHDAPYGVAEQQYAPDVVARRRATTGRPTSAPRPRSPSGGRGSAGSSAGSRGRRAPRYDLQATRRGRTGARRGQSGLPGPWCRGWWSALVGAQR